MTEKIVSAAVIIIGNEILSGRTQDTNLREIAQGLAGQGVRVTEARVVPDVANVIVATVNELRPRHDYVFTTGGLGPTHDDITAACIAEAFGVALIEHPVIAAILRSREAPPEVMAARLRMALVPEGAALVENDVGSPPGFRMGNVYVLAGIPRVMRSMLASALPLLQGAALVQSRSVVAHVGESTIATALGKVQALHPTVDIGSYPFLREGRPGTELVARSTDAAQLDAVMQALDRMLVAAGVQPSRE